MILAGTGHRPDKLGGYGEAVFQRLVSLAEAQLDIIKPDEVISGLALGWDQALATAAHNKGIPFIAAIPFEGQESVWPPKAKERYGRLRSLATREYVVSPGGYSAAKMQVRNAWMVEHCDVVLALFDGTPGGTANCVNFATGQKKKIINCWDQWKKGAEDDGHRDIGQVQV